MKCAKCGVSVMNIPLERVNPKGENGIWWCHNCIKKHEPELFKNMKEDETEVEKKLKDWAYPKSSKNSNSKP